MAAVPPFPMLIRFHLLYSGRCLLKAITKLQTDSGLTSALYSFGYYLGRIHRIMVSNAMFLRFKTPSYQRLLYSQPFTIDDAYTMMVSSLSFVDQGFAIGFVRESIMIINAQLIDDADWHKPYIKASELKDFIHIKKIFLDHIIDARIQPITFQVMVVPSMLNWAAIKHEVKMELLRW